MHPGIHDSKLVAIGFDLTKKRLSLTLEHASRECSFAFNDLEAFSVSNAALGSIISDVFTVSAHDLLKTAWDKISTGYKESGWPGPWARSLESALQFAETHALIGYKIESSYGIDGWVLAREFVQLGRSRA